MAGTKRRRGIVVLLWMGALASCAPEPSPPPPPEPPSAAPTVEPAPECLRIERLVVDKSERWLRAYCERGRVVEWTAAMGRESEGAKRALGDQRTPEGEYRISGPARASRFHRFVPIDYPSVEDARRAREDGRLSRRDFERIVAAHEAGEPPPPDTPLGGHLGLHGEGERWRGDSQLLDWTFGCIALRDEDLEFLVERIEVGTPVHIEP